MTDCLPNIGPCEKPSCSRHGFAFVGHDAMLLCEEHACEWMFLDLLAEIDAEEDSEAC